MTTSNVFTYVGGKVLGGIIATAIIVWLINKIANRRNSKSSRL